MNEIEFYLEDLKSKFNNIDFNKYYLSYSGGKDSHFLYWFIKDYLKDNKIPIISVNTRMEHKEILRRMIKYSDHVLLSKHFLHNVIKNDGSPLNSKIQDEMVRRYQAGSRSESLMKFINGSKNGGSTYFKLNKKTLNSLPSLFKVSGLCCDRIKKEPLKIYEKQTGRKPIIAVRSNEGINRKSKYNKCLHKNGNFTPIHDLDEKLFNKIMVKYNIEIPEIYKYVNRTGCVGCPYGHRQGDTLLELDLVSEARRNYVIKCFKNAYDFHDIEYQQIGFTMEELNVFNGIKGLS